jgi:hypothetical protein
MLNIAPLALETTLIYAEKRLAVGHLARQLAAGVLIVFGVVVILMPTALPMQMS